MYTVAIHEVIGEKVAIKILNKNKWKEKVQREMDHLRELKHPHIIQL